ncbi:type I methionyl aminopeptidase [Patescibacteria group bacterium]
MIIRNEQECQILREGGNLLGKILQKIAESVKPGITTLDLDNLAEKLILEAGGRPSFKGYKNGKDGVPFPASLCVSVNDEIVHGIPSDRILQKGDIVGLDIGMEYKGLFTDTAVTVGVGQITKENKHLISVTKKALQIGIASIKAGGHIGDIGEAIQKYVESKKFGVVRKLIGHGVGKKVHEDPEVPNWGERGVGSELVEGMVLALEPMVTIGSYELNLAENKWAWVTKDGKPAAHFEHTIVVTKTKAEIIT